MMQFETTSDPVWRERIEKMANLLGISCNQFHHTTVLSRTVGYYLLNIKQRIQDQLYHQELQASLLRFSLKIPDRRKKDRVSINFIA